MRRALAFIVFFPALVQAQRAGIDSHDLVPGYQITEASANHGRASIDLAPAGEHRAVVRVEVRIATDVAAAQAAADWFHETVSGELPEITGVGARARGDAGLVSFVRENVFVVVRSIAGQRQVLSIAQAIDAAILRAPAQLSTDARPSCLAPARVGESGPVHVGDAIGAHVTASGAGYARRTPRGWIIMRTSQGRLRVQVATVDRWLRVNSYSF